MLCIENRAIEFLLSILRALQFRGPLKCRVNKVCRAPAKTFSVLRHSLGFCSPQTVIEISIRRVQLKLKRTCSACAVGKKVVQRYPN